MESVTIERLGMKDAEVLIAFLQRPEIDGSFLPPLSQRPVSIATRVHSKMESGFWLIARRGTEILGCRGCNGLVDPVFRIVEFSTMSLAPEARGLGLGKLLMVEAIALSLQLYQPRQIRLDSTEGNQAMAGLMKSLGFRVSRVYPDPEKRPPGVRSVEYILDISPS